MLSQMEKFLQDFHKKNPSCTPISFASGQLAEDINSYDCLSQLVTSIERKTTVVDLACGDGALLKNIIDRKLSGLEMIGIDMSLGELEVAKKQLASYPVAFIEARAQAIPLVDSSVDFILCHMAFMLMDNIEQVVSEIHRCLKPKAIFSAIVGGKSELSPIFDQFLKLLDQALQEEGKKWLSELGDKRTRSEQGLKSLFDLFLFTKVDIRDLKLKFYERPEDLMSFFMLMYDVSLLSEKRQLKLSADFLHELKAMTDDSGRVEHFIWLRQVTCKRI